MDDARTFTPDDVTRLISTVLNGIRTGATINDRVYTLEEVAERTHFSLRSLELGCRNGSIQHTRRGKFRGMTPQQIAVLLDQHTTGGSNSAPADDMAQAREMSRNSGARRSRQRVA